MAADSNEKSVGNEVVEQIAHLARLHIDAESVPNYAAEMSGCLLYTSDAADE